MQRRHQKVIEEAPAPGMTPEMRAAMTDAAVKAARAIGYSGAGTIEFIADASQGLRPDRFWFMEMNTRLQVEHPVTEMVTGVDLVEWQLRVAAGERLPKTQAEIELCGHAFEARLYAEDPGRNFLPAIGTLHHLAFPDGAPGGCVSRIETGVRAGDAISPFYDPMIAKLVVQGPDRATALDGLASVLEATEIAGSVTNQAFLVALARDEDFRAGEVDTGLIGRKQDALTARAAPSAETVARAALAASGVGDAPPSSDPWSSLTGYAHFHPIERQTVLRHGEDEIVARVSAETGGRFRVAIDGATISVRPDEAPAASGPAAGRAPRATRWPGHVTVFSNGAAHDFAVADPFAEGRRGGGRNRQPARADARARQDRAGGKRRQRHQGPGAAGSGSDEDGAYDCRAA